jgi:hypothetical protein
MGTPVMGVNQGSCKADRDREEERTSSRTTLGGTKPGEFQRPALG